MPAGRQRRTPPQERSVFGLTMLHPSHPEVRRLQQDAARPTLHGHNKPRHDILVTSGNLS